ncbi:exodeoxyribonuclease V subunit alpha [Caviibacterium pharyngocola]|uniref:RecBCD enzyme subunit RecD n=1 Tax=Caviibacterium pharyngocola TaxID=28159 RepID=A0A2M8RUX3_9PAST|nr:exodeoxyribonuclease V subunit alpha [Caviibacterium pharyngocola]PJG82696.1 exodeoxyribonuclease V subunit alpha [Caviibacterium pharyngocola]
MLNILSRLKQQGLISAADYYFAEFIHTKQRRAFNYPQAVQDLAIFLAALCHYQYRQGHSRLILSEAYGQGFALPWSERHFLTEIQEKLHSLEPTQWQSVLREHIAFTEQPLRYAAPFVLRDGALYFYRVWQDEYQIAQYFIRMSQQSSAIGQDHARIAEVLQRYFPESVASDQPDWQKIAVAIALNKSFCLITGGPGTGKTTTVFRLLLALQEMHQNQLRIKLVAPTGKAADRLNKSIEASFIRLQTHEKIAISADLKAAVPSEAQTIHRLLGVRFFEDKTHYDQKNPLPLDVLVVDEASMIDLSLMAKLLRALKPQTKLILLGDKDQLSSVEAGAILSELGKFLSQGYSPMLTDYLRRTTGAQLASSEQGQPIRDCLCNLVVSRRFDDQSDIKRLAEAINQAQGEQSWRVLENRLDDVVKTQPEITLVDFDPYFAAPETEKTRAEILRDCVAAVVQSAVENYREYLQIVAEIAQQQDLFEPADLARIFAAFNRVRFLTALRVGELGSENLNHRIAEQLRSLGLVNFNHPRDWYAGKPIMVTQNDSNTGLLNGEIGIYLRTQDKNGEISERFWFENGQNELASRMPAYEPAFAMTVHKSQGSEFDHTLLILPTEPNPILCKELIYTGVTRAKKHITVFTRRRIWQSAVNKRTERQSGLSYLLENNE